MSKVQLFKLNYGEREVQAVADTVRSGWITMGEKTRQRELIFSELIS